MIKQILFYACLSWILISCNNSNSGNNKQSAASKPQEKQLNISILLDLSDRISPTKYPAAPEHWQRDIENIRTVTEFFKANMVHLTAWKAKGKIKVFFTPAPSNPEINKIAKNLNIDCSKQDPKGRKAIYDTLTELYTQSLTDIYEQTIVTSTWDGSDIWLFFKKDVESYCIERDATYRNILIIFTDGYLYHKQSVYNNGNRFSYLLDHILKNYRKPNWQEMIEKNDFGLITERNDLQNLEVLVLELSSEKLINKIDEDILSYVLQKWLKEMNVAHCEVYSSDLPANTKMRIDRFLDR